MRTHRKVTEVVGRYSVGWGGIKSNDGMGLLETIGSALVPAAVQRGGSFHGGLGPVRKFRITVEAIPVEKNRDAD